MNRIPLRGLTVETIERTLRELLGGRVAHGPRMTVGPEHQAGAGCIGVSIYLDPGGRRLWLGEDVFEAARLFAGCLAVLRYQGAAAEPEIVEACAVQRGDLVLLCGCRWPSEVYDLRDGYLRSAGKLVPMIGIFTSASWPQARNVGATYPLVRVRTKQ